MDSDDILPPECGEKLRLIADSSKDGNVEVFLYDYHYAFDDRGQVTTVLKRERLMRASLPWRWKYPIHEVCICDRKDGSQPTACYESGIWIVHRKHAVKEQYRDPGRNLRFIERYMPEYEAAKDGRMLFYAGNECMAAGKHEDAFRYYDQLLAMETEWKEQRALAAIRSAGMLLLQDRYDEAKQRCYMAIDIDERWADSYCILGDIAMVAKDWQKAIYFFDIAANMPIPNETLLLPYDPHKYTVYPLYRKHVALVEMQRYEEALAVLRTMIEKYEPEEPSLKARAIELAELIARTRRNGLSGVTIIRGNLPPSHPSIIRQATLADGLRAAGMDVEVVSDPGRMNLGTKLAVVFDSSARVSEEGIAKIKARHTDVVLDFCDPEESLSNDGTLAMIRNASLITTNSPFLLERLRAINPRSVYIPDPAIITTPSPRRAEDGTIRVLMASTDQKMVTLAILPLIQRVAEEAGRRLEFRVVGATGMA
jgi:hypothetical protein